MRYIECETLIKVDPLWKYWSGHSSCAFDMFSSVYASSNYGNEREFSNASREHGTDDPCVTFTTAYFTCIEIVIALYRRHFDLFIRSSLGNTYISKLRVNIVLEDFIYIARFDYSKWRPIRSDLAHSMRYPFVFDNRALIQIVLNFTLCTETDNTDWFRQLCKGSKFVNICK